MPNVLDSISPGFKALSAMLAAAGLNAVELLAANDVNALKLKLESLPGKSADAAQAVEAATKEFQTQLSAAEKSMQAALTAQATIKTGLTEAGIVLKISDETAGLTAADVKAGIAARASIMASEQLAKHGLKDPLPVTPAADATKPAAPAAVKLIGRERTVAAFAAQTSRKAAL